MSLPKYAEKLRELREHCTEIKDVERASARRAEINNLLSVVETFINFPDEEAVDEYVKAIHQRIMALIKDPFSAGNHEQFI